MDESFYFKGSPLPDLPQLPKRQFPGRHDPDGPRLLQHPRTIYPCDPHLGAGMDGQIWEPFPDKSEHPQILDDHCIQPLLI